MGMKLGRTLFEPNGGRSVFEVSILFLFFFKLRLECYLAGFWNHFHHRHYYGHNCLVRHGAAGVILIFCGRATWLAVPEFAMPAGGFLCPFGTSFCTAKTSCQAFPALVIGGSPPLLFDFIGVVQGFELFSIISYIAVGIVFHSRHPFILQNLISECCS